MLKWGTLGSNRLKSKVCRAQMGTKPAKVGRLGPRCANKCGAASTPHRRAPPQKRSSIHAASKVAKVGAAGGPKLLKWGRVSRRGRVKSAKVRPQAASHKKVFAPQKKVFAPRADQSC